MRRWEILVAAIGVGLLVWLGQIWPPRSDTEIPPLPVANHCQAGGFLPSRSDPPGVNLQAPLDGLGNPLPSTIRQDVVLEITETGYDLVFWWLDYRGEDQASNWLLDWQADGWRQKLCLVDGRYFFYNPEEVVWDEVDPSLLDKSILDLADLDRYLLAADQLADFRAVATAGPDEPCQAYNCAVWLASSLDSDDQIRIRVNKQSRRVNDVFITRLGGQITITYYYQEVGISQPEPVRFLPEGFDSP